MNIDLKGFRNEKGWTREEFAAKLSQSYNSANPGSVKKITAETVSRMEKDTTEIPYGMLCAIAEVLGKTLDQLSTKPAVTPNVKDNWYIVEDIRRSVLDALSRNDLEQDNRYKEIRSKLEQLVEDSTRKLRIACIGQPDSGKSSTINKLLGQQILPSSWTPTTSTIVYLKHITDKPSYMGSENVWIFADREDAHWDCSRIGDEAYCQKWQLAIGDYQLLRDYGAHQGEINEGIKNSVGAIVVYVDSPILRNCDLIDLPGFNPSTVTEGKEEVTGKDYYDSRDSELSHRAHETADAFIYLSVSNNFLYGDDLAMAGSIVKKLPVLDMESPLGNLFIVATMASIPGSDAMDIIINSGAERLWKLVSDHPNITDKKCSFEDGFRNRFYTSELNSEKLTERFYDDLRAFIESLPEVVRQRTIRRVQSFLEIKKSELISVRDINTAIADPNETEDYRKLLAALKANEPKRNSAFRYNIDSITDMIYRLRAESIADCTQLFNRIICSKHIIEVIENHKLKKNKKDFQMLVTLLNSELENGLTRLLSDKSSQLNGKIDGFIKAVNENFILPSVNLGKNFSFSFDAGRAFAAGLSGAATYGALAAWAAACGNLGGYILVAKGVSLLASLGIHVGGTAAAIAAVSSIGGPVVLGVTIALIASISALLILGGTWKKVIGNKIVKQYNDKKVLAELLNISNQFWDDTLAAFRTASNNIDAEWREQIRALTEKIKHNSKDDLVSQNTSIKAVLDVIESVHSSIENKPHKK